MSKVIFQPGVVHTPTDPNKVNLQAQTELSLRDSNGTDSPAVSLEGEVSLVVTAEPGTVSNTNVIYAKKVTNPELFSKNSSGGTVQLTNSGTINTNVASGSFFTSKFLDRQETFSWTIPVNTIGDLTTDLYLNPPDDVWAFYLVRSDFSIVTNGTWFNNTGDIMFLFNRNPGTPQDRLHLVSANSFSIVPSDPNSYVEKDGRLHLTFDNSGGQDDLYFTGVLTSAGPFVTPFNVE